MSRISRAAMFDWALLAPTPLFPLGNRLPGNVVIIVAEASICSICVRGGRQGRWGGLVSNPFSQVLMGGRGVKGAESSARAPLMYAGAWGSPLAAADAPNAAARRDAGERRFWARVITRL